MDAHIYDDKVYKVINIERVTVNKYRMSMWSEIMGVRDGQEKNRK